jgi:carbonic anhydrase
LHTHHPLRVVLISGLAGLLGAGGDAQAAADGHWTYAGETGPEHWAELSPDFAACGIGVNQSPIDIVEPITADLVPLVVDYAAGSVDIINNGHTLQINSRPGNQLHIGSNLYQLMQLHFHSPSEHRLNGEAFPLEAHFVHQDDQGHLAVVAVLFRDGEWNVDLEKAGKAGPTTVGQRAPFDMDFSALKMYRNHESYFSYSGSLTTPPCTEGIRWFVLKDAESISSSQTEKFVDLIGNANRGVQPLNARIVVER